MERLQSVDYFLRRFVDLARSLPQTNPENLYLFTAVEQTARRLVSWKIPEDRFKSPSVNKFFKK